jgi:hypothetical protein
VGVTRNHGVPKHFHPADAPSVKPYHSLYIHAQCIRSLELRQPPLQAYLVHVIALWVCVYSNLLRGMRKPIHDRVLYSRGMLGSGNCRKPLGGLSCAAGSAEVAGTRRFSACGRSF